MLASHLRTQPASKFRLGCEWLRRVDDKDVISTASAIRAEPSRPIADVKSRRHQRRGSGTVGLSVSHELVDLFTRNDRPVGSVLRIQDNHALWSADDDVWIRLPLLGALSKRLTSSSRPAATDPSVHSAWTSARMPASNTAAASNHTSTGWTTSLAQLGGICDPNNQHRANLDQLSRIRTGARPRSCNVWGSV